MAGPGARARAMVVPGAELTARAMSLAHAVPAGTTAVFRLSGAGAVSPDVRACVPVEETP
jgi:hypothetical protein